MEIIWTPQAEKDLEGNIDYLLQAWSEKVAQNFVQNVTQTIKQVSKNPTTFPRYESSKIRFVLLIPQITLFYEVDDNKIILLRLWNNKQDPLRRKL
jgi:plasmid stabilization system protein ParE